MSAVDGRENRDESEHSVTLDESKCKGCTNCIKRCPTEAIRVRKGRAWITGARCTDCGECIRTCPYHAKKAITDPLPETGSWRIAIPAPALYGQFEDKYSVSRVLTALKSLGFDDVVEAALGAEVAAKAVNIRLSLPDCPVPLISSSCPAVVRLIQVRFPSLVDHVAPVLSPMEIAARIGLERARAAGKEGHAYFIGPCAAKVTAARNPPGGGPRSVSGVIALKDIYLPLRAALASAGETVVPEAGAAGISWARGEGESESVDRPGRIAVDGIENVVGILEAIENGKLQDVSFVEAMACPGGCVGGPLAVENPYIAKTRIRIMESRAVPRRSPTEPFDPQCAVFAQKLEPRNGLKLDDDLMKAMIMLEEMEHIALSLPGLDCGSCGAPSCRALAEDIVRGNAILTDCVFKLRENIRSLAEEMLSLERISPPGLDRD